MVDMLPSRSMSEPMQQKRRGTFVFTHDDWRKIRMLAGNAGLSMTEWLRRLIDREWNASEWAANERSAGADHQ